MEAAVLILRARILSFSPPIYVCQWEHVVQALLSLNSRIGHIHDVSFKEHGSELGDIVVRLSVRGNISKDCQ